MHSRDRERAQARRAHTERPAPGTETGRREPAGAYLAAGNRALAHLLAREGAGLLPGGRVHPAVESLIDRRRGGGRVVDERVRARVETVTGDPLHDVRVHDDGLADALARSVQARAFATGRDLFFARGEYRPSTPAGAGLLAHELAHAAQQRQAPTSGPLSVTEPGDRFEREAERIAHASGD